MDFDGKGTTLSILISVFLTHLAVAFQAPSCGGILNKTEGSASISDVPPNTTCTWTLDLGKLKKGQVYITFKDVSLIHGQDFLVILDNTGNVNLTGDQDTFLYVGTSSQTVISLKIGSNNITTHPRTLAFEYNQDECKQNLVEGSGSFRSPYHSNAGTLQCTYTILGLPDTLNVLSFTDFSLKKGFVDVRDGPTTESPLLRNFTEKSGPADVISSTQIIMVETTLSMGQPNNSFVMSYTPSTEGCSKVVKLVDTITVTSPGYEFNANYTNNLNCNWLITGPANQSLGITIDNFDIGPNADRLTLYDGLSKLSPILGSYFYDTGISNKGSGLVSTDNSLLINFQSDSMRTARGFSITVRTQPYGGVFTDSGTISWMWKSTTSAPKIIDILNDTWYYLLKVPDNQQVYVTFDDDRLMFPTASVDCYSGSSDTDLHVGHFTSLGAPFTDVFSNSNKMLLVFRNFYGRQHIQANFSAISQGSHVNAFGSSGSVIMKNSVQMNQSTLLIQPINITDLISLEIINLNLEPNATVTIFEGLSDQSTRIVALTAFVQTFPPIYVRPNKGIRVAYMTTNPGQDESQSMDIFTVTYRIVPGCGGNYNSTKGTILSPGFPNLYPYNMDCSWSITPLNSKLVHITFDAFHTANQHPVYISKMMNGTRQLVGSFRGNDTLYDIIGTTNESLVLSFSSSAQNSLKDIGSGFKLSYENIDCGGLLTNLSSSKTISSPGFPAPLPNATICVWVIALPHSTGNNSAVNIVNFSLDVKNYINSTSTGNNSAVNIVNFSLDVKNYINSTTRQNRME
ncbi:unnamed protein product [Owenia fusiformis]|uniref:Uncharacterized protein n=1 Tax=Owenia fusiformis TaxID=6347 RepID=A0A8J1UZ60_OWEFU|nr:unnamed protein product [Owenia fusiformis]